MIFAFLSSDWELLASAVISWDQHIWDHLLSNIFCHQIPQLNSLLSPTAFVLQSLAKSVNVSLEPWNSVIWFLALPKQIENLCILQSLQQKKAEFTTFVEI